MFMSKLKLVRVNKVIEIIILIEIFLWSLDFSLKLRVDHLEV
jgi:hypothetical protein